MTKMEINQDAVGRYQISIGAGKRFRAKNLMEVGSALEHFFQGIVTNTDEEFSHTEHKHNAEKFDNCPLCRD